MGVGTVNRQHWPDDKDGLIVSRIQDSQLSWIKLLGYKI